MNNLLSTGSFFALCLLLFVPVSAASSTQPVFGGAAEITVPEGALFYESGFRRGLRFIVVVGSESVSVRSERLPRRMQKLSNARWARAELSFYRNKNYKREYRFRKLELSAVGNIVSVEVQSTVKRGAKRTTLRQAERKIRVDNATVITAQFVTDKPSNWNNEDSIALREVVASLRQPN